MHATASRLRVGMYAQATVTVVVACLVVSGQAADNALVTIFLSFFSYLNSTYLLPFTSDRQGSKRERRNHFFGLIFHAFSVSQN